MSRHIWSPGIDRKFGPAIRHSNCTVYQYAE